MCSVDLVQLSTVLPKKHSQSYLPAQSHKSVLWALPSTVHRYQVILVEWGGWERWQLPESLWVCRAVGILHTLAKQRLPHSILDGAHGPHAHVLRCASCCVGLAMCLHTQIS